MAVDSSSDGHGSDGSGQRGSKYRVAALLTAQIDAGVYSVGDQLPSVRELRTEFGVGHDTAQGAVRLLAQDGKVRIRSRKGAFVVEQATPVPPETQLKRTFLELRELQARFRETRRTLLGLEEKLADLTDRLSVVE